MTVARVDERDLAYLTIGVMEAYVMEKRIEKPGLIDDHLCVPVRGVRVCCRRFMHILVLVYTTVPLTSIGRCDM